MSTRWRGIGTSTWLLGLCLLMAGCSAKCGFEHSGGGGIGGVSIGVGSEPASPSAAPGAVAIDFRSDPNPPKSGSNAVEVVVKDADGRPVSDATVKVVFSMPAMPSMNMPAMRSEVALAHDSDGRYRGTGDLSMAGTWNVNVIVSRGTEEIGSRNLSIIAK